MAQIAKHVIEEFIGWGSFAIYQDKWVGWLPCSKSNFVPQWQ